MKKSSKYSAFLRHLVKALSDHFQRIRSQNHWNGVGLGLKRGCCQEGLGASNAGSKIRFRVNVG